MCLRACACLRFTVHFETKFVVQKGFSDAPQIQSEQKSRSRQTCENKIWNYHPSLDDFLWPLESVLTKMREWFISKWIQNVHVLNFATTMMRSNQFTFLQQFVDFELENFSILSFIYINICIDCHVQRRWRKKSPTFFRRESFSGHFICHFALKNKKKEKKKKRV